MQPYIALALQLIISQGHRVRIATHAEFAGLVTEACVRLAGLTDPRGVPLTAHLDHYDIGGKPRPVLEYMTMSRSRYVLRADVQTRGMRAIGARACSSSARRFEGC